MRIRIQTESSVKQKANSMRIECAFVVFTLESGFGRCTFGAHRVNPPLEVDWNRIGT